MNDRNRYIAGGSNLFSKRGELYAPGQWPDTYVSAKGILVTTLGGRQYRDFTTQGLGANILGFADPDVNGAVIRAIDSGSSCTINCDEEVELAKLLTTIHPWAYSCKFTRSGGEAIAVALRLALTKNRGRKVVLTTGYHGWAVNDPTNKNSPLYSSLTFKLAPDDLGAAQDWMKNRQVAAIVVEPRRYQEPPSGYLEGLRETATQTGVVLIFDEITSGFRFNLGGVHLKYNVNPDVAVFAKAMSNGYPMGAVIGTEEVMAAHKDTFISSTSWSERIGPAASLATIQKFWVNDVHEHLEEIGRGFQNIMIYCAQKSGLQIKLSGPPQLTHVDFGSLEVQTLYTQLMLEKGFLTSKDFYPSYAHKQEDLEDFLVAIQEVFPALEKAKKEGKVKELLKGPIAESGIRR